MHKIDMDINHSLARRVSVLKREVNSLQVAKKCC